MVESRPDSHGVISRETKKKNLLTLPTSIHKYRDHPNITSSKGLGGWGQKNGNNFLLTFSTI